MSLPAPAPDMPAEPAPTPPGELRALCRTALFAAMVGAGAFLHVPVGPLYISLQTMMVMLTGFLLGPRRAAGAMLLYLGCGCIGMPVFGRGLAGPASFLGPTAGFLPGFLLGAVTAGLSVRFTRTRRGHMAAMLFFGFAGTVLLLLSGTAGLRLTTVDSWDRAFAVGFMPFILGDTVKMIAAAAVRQAFFPPPAAGGEGRNA